jgi:hypothetical protein
MLAIIILIAAAILVTNAGVHPKPGVEVLGK